MTDKQLQEILGLQNESSSVTDLLSKFSNKIKVMSSVDDVVLKDLSARQVQLTQSDEFLVNTKKPYVDNQLSGYSAFADLINYYNNGYRSCLILPVTSFAHSFGIITLLSKKENFFDGQTVESLSTASNIIGNIAFLAIEKKRNLNVARYFDASFSNAMPQFLVKGNGSIVKANKIALNIIEKTQKDLASTNITSVFSIDKDALSKITGNIPVTVGLRGDPDKTFRVTAIKVNERLYHLLFQDITELSRLSELSRFFENSETEAFMLLDNDSRIRWVSDNIDKLFNVNKNAMINAKLIDMIVTKPDEFASKLVNAGSSASTVHVKLNFGNDIIADVAARVYRSKNGFSLILSKDYSNYINQIEKNLEDIMQLSTDPILIIDGTGYIRKSNRSAERFFLPKEQLIGIPISSLFTDTESQNKLSNSMLLAKNSNLVNDVFVNMLSSRSKEPQPFLQNVKILRDDGGNTAGYILVGKELSTKRNMERLEEEHEKAENDSRRYKAESELKTQFIYNISHDLKTPITSITGYSKLMLDGELGQITEEQKEYIQIIKDSGDRLMALIQQILDVAKLSSGKIKLDLQQMNFNDIAKNPSIRDMELLCQNKGLKFSWTTDYDVPEVTADPNRMIQVLVNLIGNAVKFTQGGEITVRVRRKSKTKVLVEVHDTGIGISKEEKSKIFKKFYQIRRKDLTMQPQAGTGLGLSIVWEIVHLHNGKCDVDSELGKGSTFWFLLPIRYKQPKTKQSKDTTKPVAPQPT